MGRAARRRRSPALVVATLAMSGTVVSLQQTLMLPVLPDVPRLLHTTADNASWVVTATLVSGAVAVPTLSRLADMFGKKRMILVAFAVMAVGSVLGALSPGLGLVILARALQGVGLAVLPIGIAIMRDELPSHRLALGIALMSATLAIGAGAGLPLSGLIVANVGWRAIFWVTAGASILSLVVVAGLVPESPIRRGGSFDYTGALLLSGAMTALLLALSKGSLWGWLSARTLGLAVLGVVLLAVWIPLELRSSDPLVDVRIASRPAVLLVNIASVLAGFAMFTNMVSTAQLLQLKSAAGFGLNLDVFHAGLWMAPTALVFGAFAPVAAWLIGRFGAQITLLGGAAVMAVTYVARVFLSGQLWQVVLGSVVVGVGTSMTFAAMPSLITAAVPATETASANGLNTLLRSVGTSTASAAVAALTTGLATTVGSVTQPTFAAFAASFWIAAGASATAALVTVPLLRA